LIAVAVSLLSYFICMIIVLTAALGAMIGLSSFSTFEGAHHYQRPALERDVTATNEEPRLFMSVPVAKDASPAKNVEAQPAAVPDEKEDVKKNTPDRHTAIARKRNNYERPSYRTGMGYAEEFRNAPQRPFSSW
jgi:hypothetical protein